MKYKLYWMHSKHTNNFGDVLTPKLFDFFSLKYEYQETDFDTICIGSTGNKVNKDCLVLGTGIAWEKTKLEPNAKWLFTRGPLTRNALINSGGYCPEIYGDPALLLPLFCDESKKTYDLGIIPHVKEYDLVKKMYPKHHVINLNNSNPLYVAKEITKCRATISSSLHGLICSHAYNIPTAWVKFSDMIIGDDTKYKDHYSSIGLDCELSNFECPKFSTKLIKIDHIIEIFKSLK